MKFYIPFRYLKALVSLAGTNKRYSVIDSVLLEIVDDQVALVATDGRMLGLIFMSYSVAVVDPRNSSGRTQFIIPSELIERACEIDQEGVASVSIDTDNVHISISEVRKITFSAPLIRDRFPNWRPLFQPYKLAALGDTVVNPAFVECFTTVGATLYPGYGSAGMTIARLKEYQGWKPTETPLVFRFTHEPRFIGLLMPLNSEGLKNEVNAIKELPGWIEPAISDLPPLAEISDAINAESEVTK